MPYIPRRRNLTTRKRTAFAGSRSQAAIDRQKMYNNRKWRALSKRSLQQSPLCVECAKHGKTTAAQVLDHIQPHKGNQELFWDTDNHQTLCHPCHNSKSAKER